MDRSIAVLMTAAAGGLVALQAPINSRLGKNVGTLPAASISFAIGVGVLVALVLASGDAGGVTRAGHGPWWSLLGGVLGAAYVATVLVTVRTLGAGGVTAATIAGQLTLAVAIDHFGLVGVSRHPINAGRLAGLALLAAGVFLVVRQ